MKKVTLWDAYDLAACAMTIIASASFAFGATIFGSMACGWRMESSAHTIPIWLYLCAETVLWTIALLFIPSAMEGDEGTTGARIGWMLGLVVGNLLVGAFLFIVKT